MDILALEMKHNKLVCPNCNYGSEVSNWQYCPHCGVKLVNSAVTDPTVKQDLFTTKNPSELHLFRDAYKENLPNESYVDILQRLNKMICEHCGFIVSNSFHGTWSESDSMISVYEEYSACGYHDTTYEYSIRLILEHLNTIEDHYWSHSEDWPSESHLLYEQSIHKGERFYWRYDKTHKVWILKDFYNMPGFWRFTYEAILEH